MANVGLSHNDEIGRQFEDRNYDTLVNHGYFDNIVFFNPTKNPALWKRERGKGADKEIHVSEYSWVIEEKYCTKPYKYRKAWFRKTVRPRFKNPIFDHFHRRIVLTNRVENFSSVKDLLAENGIRVMTFNELLSHLYTITLLTNNDNITINNKSRVTYSGRKEAFSRDKRPELQDYSFRNGNIEFFGDFG